MGSAADSETAPEPSRGPRALDRKVRHRPEKRPRVVAYGTDQHTPAEEVLHRELMNDGSTVAVVTELAHTESVDATSGPRMRRLRFFAPSKCGEFLDSSEVQSETKLDASGEPDCTCLSLPYHRIMAACTCWHRSADNRRRRDGRILVIGGGGGCVARYLNATLRTTVDVVEVEPAVVGIAQKFFTSSGALLADLTWHTEDGVSFVARHAAQSSAFDAVIVDVSHTSDRGHVSRTSAAPVDTWDMAAPSPEIVAPAVLSGLASLTRCVLINVLPSELDNTGCSTNDDCGRGSTGPQSSEVAERSVQRIARLLSAAGFTSVDELQAEAVSNRVLLCRHSVSDPARERLKGINGHELGEMTPMKELLGPLRNFEVRRVVLTE